MRPIDTKTPALPKTSARSRRTDSVRPTTVPLYRQIQGALRERIQKGVWSVGQALPNRRTLCTEFQTTRVTLDKAVDELVREGWLRSAPGSGTYVAEGDRAKTGEVAFRERPTGVLRIGIVLGRSTFSDPDDEMITEGSYFAALFQGMRLGTGSDHSVDLGFVSAAEGDYEAIVQNRSFDGLILLTPLLDDLPKLRRLYAASVPFVAVGISSDATPEDEALPCIDSNNRWASREITQHLLDLGHRRIAVVNLSMSHANHQDRMEGYYQALETAGIEALPEYIVTYPVYEARFFEPCVDEWLTRLRQENKEFPTAIFVCDYSMALTTLRSLRRQGIRVPEDVSLAGFDDYASAAHLSPPLTTVRQPLVQMGRRAVQRLVEHLRNNPPGTSVKGGTERLAAEPVLRLSTRPPLR